MMYKQLEIVPVLFHCVNLCIIISVLFIPLCTIHAHLNGTCSFYNFKLHKHINGLVYKVIFLCVCDYFLGHCGYMVHILEPIGHVTP